MLLDLFMVQFQQHTMLEEGAGAMHKTMAAQEAELQCHQAMLLSLSSQNAALGADKTQLMASLKGLRKGFLRVCTRWEGAREETEAAKDRLAKKEEEMNVLRVEKEEYIRRCRFVLNEFLFSCCL